MLPREMVYDCLKVYGDDLFAAGLLAPFGELLPSFSRMKKTSSGVSESLFLSDANLPELRPIVIFNRFKRIQQAGINFKLHFLG